MAAFGRIYAFYDKIGVTLNLNRRFFIGVITWTAFIAAGLYYRCDDDDSYRMHYLANGKGMQQLLVFRSEGSVTCFLWCALSDTAAYDLRVNGLVHVRELGSSQCRADVRVIFMHFMSEFFELINLIYAKC